MTNTIEVPISLIKAGDLDAIRELLPKENLFGRWATHLTLGRGIIISAHPDQHTFVKFANGKSWSYVAFDNLTLDPVELTTLEDFEDAPEGTVISDTGANAYQKLSSDAWESRNDYLTDKEMAVSGPWKILRWGWGE
ncbi:TPA: hypothetical protein ACGIYY_001087 [Corynebacterium striatum]|uniref:hypothetical protein n=1 Tax=Corynebacterium striatum TaxID=43770 RepID=UPI00141A309C|nr:hypothetical protein [Corynebacterium striatum]NHX52993.1 hypothetical protein [Corynebacterium striatum]NHY37605.1 hypothetical protein [Corynebacterium striatum]HAT1133951.1 hypothetical protein [Corynebacterium striatum]HAT1239920.1 hypothetical protein [Corynebacterium striatum]HAT1246608.1 hypothetical protein [Corynebacterium striatum]